MSTKTDVRNFWGGAACGEALLLEQVTREGYQKQAERRYQLEPFIRPFARFEQWRGRRVLEIGVGLGADHQQFAQCGAELSGIDLTERAISHTRRRLSLAGLQSDLRVGDAEALDFPDSSFDLVYSWGVIHHSPQTRRAVDEIRRVLRPGGHALIMIYHSRSIVGYMLWLRYALLRCRPLTSLKEIYARHLESPGTKAYTVRQARRLFAKFTSVSIESQLTHGDLLTSAAGQRHRGAALSLARRVWPRRAIQEMLPGHGLFLLISAVK